MIAIRPRGKNDIYHLDLSIGRLHPVRGTLGTRDKVAALKLKDRLEMAVAEGPRSIIWRELKPAIPGRTFSRLVKFVGIKESPILTFQEFRARFEAGQRQRVKMNKLASKTADNYQRTLNSFEEFLEEQQIKMLQDIDRCVIDDYGMWKIDQIERPQSTGGSPSLDFDLRHLHHFFQVALDRKFVDENPVPGNVSRCGDQHISEPFSADEDALWEEHARRGPSHPKLFPCADEWLPYWILRWTGFRPYDAITLVWQEISFRQRVITHVCHKNHTRVTIPILPDTNLFAVLEAEYQRRNPLPTELVLLNASTGKGFTGKQLWETIVELGECAGVPESRPYRFRGTFAVDMQIRLNDIYAVARLLGDTVAIVEDHYMPYVRELQERARLMLEGGNGLRQFVTRASQ